MALHHAQPGEAVRLAGLSRDHATALVKTDQFETIHLVLKAGATLASHRVSGEFTLHCLTGRIRLSRADDADVTLEAGEWLYLGSGEEHGAEGIEDATLLLTIHF